MAHAQRPKMVTLAVVLVTIVCVLLAVFTTYRTLRGPTPARIDPNFQPPPGQSWDGRFRSPTKDAQQAAPSAR